MASLRAAFAALALAMPMLSAGPALACERPLSALRDGIGCGLAMASSADREFGIFGAEWDQIFRIVGEYDQRYMYASTAELPEIEAAFHERLNALRSAGNPIASLVIAYEITRQPNQISEPERHDRIRRGVPFATEAAEAGSILAILSLVATFSNFPGTNGTGMDGVLLPTEMRTCWDTAMRSFESLPKQWSGIAKDDSRLWQGRACIAPTLEALRR